MATNGKTERELWEALRDLDDDLLDAALPESVVDAELKAMGVDPVALAKRGIEFALKAKEEMRLSWQKNAREDKARLQSLASKATTKVPALIGRQAILARLEALRDTGSAVGPAIKMAARKRKPEESTDDQLRVLLEEMEALRSIEDDKE